MNKKEFIDYINSKLENYPTQEVEKAVAFYSESIEDRIEDGMSEEEAVSSLGNIGDIVKDIQSDMPINAIVKNKIESHKNKEFDKNDSKNKKNNNNALIIIIALITSPIWISALLGVIGVIAGIIGGVFGLGIALIALFAVFTVIGVIMFIYCTVMSISMPVGVVILLIGLMLIGIGLLVPVTKGVIWAFKKIIEGIKWCYKKIKMALV